MHLHKLNNIYKYRPVKKYIYIKCDNVLIQHYIGNADSIFAHGAGLCNYNKKISKIKIKYIILYCFSFSPLDLRSPATTPRYRRPVRHRTLRAWAPPTGLARYRGGGRAKRGLGSARWPTPDVPPFNRSYCHGPSNRQGACRCCRPAVLTPPAYRRTPNRWGTSWRTRRARSPGS